MKIKAIIIAILVVIVFMSNAFINQNKNNEDIKKLNPIKSVQSPLWTYN